jgi:hypothetical protein
MAQMLRDARIVSAEDGRWIGERFEDVLQGAVLRAQKADLIAIRSQWMEGNRDFEVTAVMAIFSESGSAEHPPDRRFSIQVMRDLQERAKLYGLPLHWMFPRQAQAAAQVCRPAHEASVLKIRTFARHGEVVLSGCCRDLGPGQPMALACKAGIDSSPRRSGKRTQPIRPADPSCRECKLATAGRSRSGSCGD